jgi:hypothetical protein
MAKNRPRPNNNKRSRGFDPNSPTRSLYRPPVVTEPQATVVYGKPFVVLEDESKKTFVFKAGSWVEFEASISECKQQSCQVKQLAQKVNRMTRYEVRCPE